ncbi:hypothetical protein KIH41_11085 [Litoribacter ruber]|uniref:hypothetical protein n=1 Tax=Litoribacter ruber TaxID=702568 RepID=UPI001BD947BC|nr:hypothetical protein [Litoribacter ruber]MBT0811821.1 hypothetical protein [Litoribacter ruber]
MVAKDKVSFRGTFLVYVVPILEFPVLALMTVLYFTGQLGEDGHYALLLVFASVIFATWLVFNLRLELRLDQYHLSYRFPPFINRTRKFKREDIVSLQIKRDGGLLDEQKDKWRALWTKDKTFRFLTDHILVVHLPEQKLVFSINEVEAFQKMIVEFEEKKLSANESNPI